MVGSKQRKTMQGNAVMATDDVFALLRQVAPETLRSVFLEAKNHGASPLMLGDVQYFLKRQADHTFTCEPGTLHNVSL